MTADIKLSGYNQGKTCQNGYWRKGLAVEHFKQEDLTEKRWKFLKKPQTIHLKGMENFNLDFMVF